MKKGIFNLLSMSILFFANQGYAQQINSHLQANSTLQNHVSSILKENIKKIHAINGQIIIMDCKSGEIKAMVNLMNTKAWLRGGNGKTSVQQGFLLSSNIATYLTVKQAFGKEYDRFYKAITNMGYGLPQNSFKAILPSPYNDISLAKFVNGKNQQISPLQILTFYNAIANNGKMIKPTFHKRDTTIIKEQLASKENIAIIQQLLVQKVKDGLAHQAHSNTVSIAGEQGAVAAKDDRDNTVYCLQFCGYYPSDNPQYSIIISLNKKGLPASGGMAASIVTEIIECNN